MHTVLNHSTIQITCTFAELALMESNDLNIYGTPSTDGRIVEVYMASVHKFIDDRVIASWEDFAVEEGWDNLGWQEMSQDDLDACGDDETTITLPRTMAEIVRQRYA